MSTAEKIAIALGDATSSGKGWKCRCPLCGGKMSISDGDRSILWHCWGGCDGRDLGREIRRRDLFDGAAPLPISEEERASRQENDERKRRQKVADAIDMWGQAYPVAGTLAERYLRNRRITVPIPKTLRFIPRCWHSPGIYRPALLALIEHVEHGPVGVSATYLSMTGEGKTTLDPPRKFLGVAKGGAVPLCPTRDGDWLGVGEGVETMLTVAQMTGWGVWAALSTSGLRHLVLPAGAVRVVLCVDNDENGAGQSAARDAAKRFLAEGRRVRIALSPIPGTDWNDILMRAHLPPQGGDHAPR
jgi:phage/plasmid primase-like uncharacterized protein